MQVHGKSTSPREDWNNPRRGPGRRETATTRKPREGRRESGGVLRDRERLGEERTRARKQWTGRTGPEQEDSRGVGTGWEPAVPDPGPFRRYLLEVPVDRMQVVLEVRNEGLLPALQRLLVPHAILQAVKHPAHAGAQRLDGTNGLGKGLQVHTNV